MMRPSAPVRRSVVRSAAAPRPFVTAAPRPARRSMPRVMAVAAGAAPTFQSAPAVPVVEKGELTQYPNSPGVYAVYDANKKLQYIGLSRKISASVATHMQELKDLTQFVKFAGALPLPRAEGHLLHTTARGSTPALATCRWKAATLFFTCTSVRKELSCC